MDSKGRSILEGREIVSFSNAEEEQAGKIAVSWFSAAHRQFGIKPNSYQDIPFLVETRIKELGGKYVCAQPWEVSAGPIYTE